MSAVPQPIPGVSLVGSGAVSTVYAVGPFAVKVCSDPADPRRRAHWEHGVEFLCRFAGAPYLPSFASVHSYHDGDLTFRACAMPLYKPVDLTRVPFDKFQVRKIAYSIGRALSFLHASGYVHNDVKPTNVVLDGDFARLIDFDSVRPVGAPTDFTTYAYRSPELLLKRRPPADPRNDVWAWGVCVYELISGESLLPRIDKHDPTFLNTQLGALAVRLDPPTEEDFRILPELRDYFDPSGAPRVPLEPDMFPLRTHPRLTPEWIDLLTSVLRWVPPKELPPILERHPIFRMTIEISPVLCEELEISSPDDPGPLFRGPWVREIKVPFRPWYCVTYRTPWSIFRTICYSE